MTSQAKHFLRISSQDFDRLRHSIDLSLFQSKIVFVTGGTGFFGAWILALFHWIHHESKNGPQIYCLSRDPERFLSRHPWARNADWLRWVIGDIRDFCFPEADIDYLLHAATETSASASDNPNELLASLIEGTQRVLEFSKHNKIQNILLVSSGGAYGAQPTQIGQLEETYSYAPLTTDPKNAYGEGKRVMELLGAIHAKSTSANVTIARCFAFVGAGLPLHSHFAIGNFIRDALYSDQLIIEGDGTAIRSYLYAADLVVWLLKIMAKGQSCRIYNVGSDEAMNMLEIANIVVNTLAPGKSIIVKKKPGTSPVGNRYIPSIKRAQELGLRSWTDLPLAIKQTAFWEGVRQ